MIHECSLANLQACYVSPYAIVSLEDGEKTNEIMTQEVQAGTLSTSIY